MSGASYFWGVYEIDGSNVVTSVLEQKGFTAGATGRATTLVTFDSPAALTAGSRYAVIFTRSDASTTTSCGLHAGSGDIFGMPRLQTETYLTYRDTTMAVSTASSGSGANPYAVGVVLGS